MSYARAIEARKEKSGALRRHAAPASAFPSKQRPGSKGARTSRQPTPRRARLRAQARKGGGGFAQFSPEKRAKKFCELAGFS
jgi:hypothetical protein